MSVPRLAVYGSLAPGKLNHHVVAPLGGTWTRGAVRGILHRTGWGAARGFPGLEWDPDGPTVPVQVLTAPDLDAHWDRIDAFEGDDYRRTLVAVELDAGAVVPAFIYLVRWADPDLRPVLRRLIDTMDALGAPLEVTGGLAARIHAATRPLVDVDVWVPAPAAETALARLGGRVVRPFGPHRDAHWDLTFGRIDLDGVPLEIGVPEGGRYRDAAGAWHDVTVDFARSERGVFQGVELPVTPVETLRVLKGRLGRPVDIVDVAGMGEKG